MDSSTFSGLQEHFISKLSDVQMMMEVRDAIKDDDSDCLHYIQVSVYIRIHTQGPGTYRCFIV